MVLIQQAGTCQKAAPSVPTKNWFAGRDLSKAPRRSYNDFGLPRQKSPAREKVLRKAPRYNMSVVVLEIV